MRRCDWKPAIALPLWLQMRCSAISIEAIRGQASDTVVLSTEASGFRFNSSGDRPPLNRFAVVAQFLSGWMLDSRHSPDRISGLF